MATVPKTSRLTEITLASAGAGPFDLDFRLFDDDGLEVYVDGVKTTDFTIQSTYVNGYDDDATITFGTTLSSGSVVLVFASLVPDRSDDLVAGSPSLLRSLNVELGRLWSAMSDLYRDVHRSTRILSTTALNALPATPSRLIGLDASGLPSLYTISPVFTAGEAVVYSTVIALMASEEPSRGIGAIWQAGGFFYEEVTSGEHLTTAGGVKLYVRWSSMPFAEAFGVVSESYASAATDNTAKLNAALQALKDAGGGVMMLPDGTIGLSGVMTVPLGVSIAGTGGGSNGPGSHFGTILKFLGASAKVVVEGRGGVSRDVTIDANGFGTPGTPAVHLDYCTQRGFDNITIVDGSGDGLLEDGGQNNWYTRLFISRFKGDEMVLDNGAGGNKFMGFEFAKCGGYGIHIKDGVGGSSYTTPTNNLFLGGHVERGHDDTSQTKGMLRQIKGDRNKFVDVVFSVAGGYTVAGGDAAVQVETNGGNLSLTNCTIYGGSASELLRTESGCAVDILERISLRASPNAIRYNGGTINFACTIETASVTNLFHASSAASPAALYGRLDKALLVTERAGGLRIARFKMSDDSSYRLDIDQYGGLLFANGTDASDVDLKRWGVGELRTSGKMLAADGLGVGNATTAAIPGTQTKYTQIFDGDGNALGYVPIYTT